MITIGITAWEEEDSIGKTIESIVKQGLEDYEIIVVAGGNDKTCDIVREYSKQNSRIKLFEEKIKQGKPNALNKLFKNAKGDIVVLTDGDVFPAENSIKELLKGFNDSKIGAVSGRPVPLNKKDSMLGFWAYVSYELMHNRRTRALKENNLFHVSGYLYAIKKELFSEIPEDSLVDDAVIGLGVLSKGYKINYAPEAKVFVKFPATIKDFLKQKRRTRAGFYQLSNKYNNQSRSFLDEAKKHLKESFSFVKNLKELGYLLAFQFFTSYSWVLANYDLKLRKKSFNQIWKEVRTTK